MLAVKLRYIYRRALAVHKNVAHNKRGTRKLIFKHVSRAVRKLCVSALYQPLRHIAREHRVRLRGRCFHYLYAHKPQHILVALVGYAVKVVLLHFL